MHTYPSANTFTREHKHTYTMNCKLRKLGIVLMTNLAQNILNDNL